MPCCWRERERAPHRDKGGAPAGEGSPSRNPLHVSFPSKGTSVACVPLLGRGGEWGSRFSSGRRVCVLLRPGPAPQVVLGSRPLQVRQQVSSPESGGRQDTVEWHCPICTPVSCLLALQAWGERTFELCAVRRDHYRGRSPKESWKGADGCLLTA